MEIKIVDLVKAAGYKDTEYQYCEKVLSASEKHKKMMSRSAFKGDIIYGNMPELIKDLKELVEEYLLMKIYLLFEVNFPEVYYFL